MGIVQTAQNIANATSVTVTLPNPTTAGNCLVVAMQSVAVTTNGTISGITLGGSADNFGQLYQAGTGSSGGISVFWADPNCAGGQTSVVVTTTGSSGTETIAATVWEVSGLPATLAALLDGSTGNPNGAASTSFSSGATGTTTQASEIAFGVVGAGRTPTAGSGWVASAPQSGSGGVSLAAYQVLTSKQAVTFSGTLSSSSAWGAAVVTLKTVPGGALLLKFP